jgi:hypothetical protein
LPVNADRASTIPEPNCSLPGTRSIACPERSVESARNRRDLSRHFDRTLSGVEGAVEKSRPPRWTLDSSQQRVSGLFVISRNEKSSPTQRTVALPRTGGFYALPTVTAPPRAFENGAHVRPRCVRRGSRRRTRFFLPSPIDLIAGFLQVLAPRFRKKFPRNDAANDLFAFLHPEKTTRRFQGSLTTLSISLPNVYCLPIVTKGRHSIEYHHVPGTRP